MLKNAVLAILLAAAPMLAWALEDVRGWDHGDYGRLVFEWSRPVSYTAVQDGRTLTLRFDAPLTASPKAALGNLGEYITGLASSPDNKTVTLTLREAFALRHYREKGTVVLDFRRPVAVPPSPVDERVSDKPPPPRTADANVKTPPSLPSIAIALTATGDDLRATFDWRGKTPAYRVEQGGPQTVTVIFSAPAQMDGHLPKSKDKSLPQGFRTVTSETTADTLRVTLETSRAIATLNSQADSDGAAVVNIRLAIPPVPETPKVSPRPAAEADTAAPDASVSESSQPVPPASDSAAGEAAPLTPTVTTSALTTTLGFPWLEETAAAVFRRAGFVWIVFDRPAQLDLSQLRHAAPEQIATVASQPHPTATILRLKAAPGLNPKLWRRGTAWQVDLRPQDVLAEVDVKVEVEPEALPTPRLQVSLPGLGRHVETFDPAVGDRIWIVPVQGANAGVTRARQFPEVLLPATAQGILVVPAVADLRVAPEAGVIVITAPSGLHLSHQTEEPATLENLAPGQEGRLFDLRRWSRAGEAFAEQRQKLQSAIIDAPQSQRSVRRMLLAEFLFTHGYASEARGVLGVVATDDPAVEQLPFFHGLMGAALMLDNRIAEGLNHLKDDRLDRFPEVRLWRGAALAQLGQTAEAIAMLASAPGIPDDYPPSLAMALTVPLAETWIGAQQTGDKLTRLLDDVGTRDLTAAERSRLQYLAALRLRAEGKTVAARQLFEKLENGSDHWSRTRAAFALVQMGLAQGHLPSEQAIATLEKLRFAWRGDMFEFRILRTLGELLLQEKRYRYGMQVLAKTLGRFPDVPEAKQLDELMRSTFRQLYLDGAADALPPLQALSLFDEFRRLTPEDESGDKMIRKLADRLVAVDLLDRAGDLLEHQIRERLSGAARGRTGAHLALIKLLDRKPEDALKALDLSNVEEISDHVRDERRLLRARALAMQGKRDLALSLIEPDASRSADRLRAEIYWETENYPLLIAVLERLVRLPADGTTLDNRQAQGVVNLAMALSLNQDYQKLATLRSTAAALMAKTPYQQMFDIITRTPETTDINNYAEISAQFAEIRNFESFLEEYRQRLKNGQLSALN